MTTSDQDKQRVENEMIDLLRRKQPLGLTLLYENYAPAIFNIVLNIVRSEEIAKEVLQDSFLKIFNNAEKFDRTKGRLFTWMVQVSRNTAIDTLRSGQFKREEKTESIPDYVYNHEGFSEEMSVRDSGLLKVLDKLDEKYRKIIYLLYFQDYTQKEVSEALDIPLGSVKSRVRKAISELREILDERALFLLLLLSFMQLILTYFGH